MTINILIGDALETLKTLPDESVHCCVTSPPYWGLRDYGVEGQLGLEPTPEGYVAHMVEVFREVRRVLRSDGTCWGNWGDSYFSNNKGDGGPSEKQLSNAGSRFNAGSLALKPKDLCGIPWRVAFALQADGWYLRQDIIWAKPNPMPESVTDRCTKAHEYVFLLTKSAKYFYDAEAVKEKGIEPPHTRPSSRMGKKALEGLKSASPNMDRVLDGTRNRRSVWTIATQPFSGAHFATFPPALIEPMIKAGCSVNGTVLDPFFGAGTTGIVAARLGRNAIGIELNPEYAEMAAKRIRDDNPMFNEVKISRLPHAATGV